MQASIKYSIILTSFLLGGSFLIYKSISYSTNTILIESQESKNFEMKNVFNQINWISTPTQDIWMMNQSHYGVDPSKDKWERLAIVIDKKTTPMTARYYQMKPGSLEWNDNLVNERVPYRASCFTCHSNGPRAIRPVSESAAASLSMLDKLKVAVWNLRIKTYPRIHYDKTHEVEDLSMSPPFRHTGPRELDELKVASCIRCHKETGFFSRGTLVRQQSGTIQHMVESGHMPPPGFSLSAKDKKELRDFLRGF